MVSHPCLFVFAVFGLRSIIAGEVKCKTLVDSRNAVLDCHLPCESPTFIRLLKWTKDQSILALYKDPNYTHTNRFGFRQPWNANSSNISLQINNPKKEDSGEYNYSVVSQCEIFTGSVHLEIPDLTTPSPVQHNESETVIGNALGQEQPGKSRHSQVLPVVGILTAALVLGIIALWMRKKNQFLCATSEISEQENNLPVENLPLGSCTECRVEEGLLQTKQDTDAYVGEIHSSEA